MCARYIKEVSRQAAWAGGGGGAAEMDRFPKVNPIWKLDRFRFVGAQYVWKFWRSMIGLSLPAGPPPPVAT